MILNDEQWPLIKNRSATGRCIIRLGSLHWWCDQLRGDDNCDVTKKQASASASWLFLFANCFLANIIWSHISNHMLQLIWFFKLSTDLFFCFGIRYQWRQALYQTNVSWPISYQFYALLVWIVPCIYIPVYESYLWFVPCIRTSI